MLSVLTASQLLTPRKPSSAPHLLNPAMRYGEQENGKGAAISAHVRA